MVSGVTNSAGDCVLTLAPGNYTCLVDKTGYQNGGATIPVSSNGQRFVIDLTPKGVSTATITISVSGVGTICADGTCTTSTTSRTYNIGDTATFSAVPGSGYKFDHFEGSGDTTTANPFQTVISGSGTVTAVFVPISGGNVTITVHVEDSSTKQPIAGANVTVS